MAKKVNIKNTLIKLLPLVILLAGLIIMTVCFFTNGSKLSDANACIADQNAKIEALAADLAAKQAELDELTAKLADNSDLDAKQAEIDTLKADNEALKIENADLQIAVENADAKLSAILEVFGIDLDGEDADETPAE